MDYKNILCSCTVEEQKAILKYFFLIDVNSVISNVHAKINDQMNSTPLLFSTIFEEIFLASSLYNSFIANDGSSFFSEKHCYDKKRLTLLNNYNCVLKLALRNHCITQGFFQTLDIHNHGNEAKLSATYEEYISSGYFEKPEPYKTSISPSNHPTQNYNSRFKAFFRLNENSFLRKTMRQLCSKPPEKNGRAEIMLLRTYKAWGFTLFTSNTANTISRKFEVNDPASAKRAIRLFNELQETFDAKEASLKSIPDKFIFHTLTEKCIGTSAILYVSKILTVLYESGSEADDTILLYDGKILDNIFEQLSLCPLLYSRHLFLDYAFHALNSNEFVKCDFLKYPPDHIGTILPKEPLLSKEECAAQGLALISKYFKTLNTLTVPILSTMWNIVLNELLPDENTRLFRYKSYINRYYDLLTFDYCNLSDDDILSCSGFTYDNSPDNIYPFFNLKALQELIDSKISFNKDKKRRIENTLLPERIATIIKGFWDLNYSTANEDIPFDQLFQKSAIDDPYQLQINTFRFNQASNIFKTLF